MCFMRRVMHVCTHESYEEGMCPEASLENRLGACSSGLDNKSGRPMPVLVTSFCETCQQDIKDHGTRLIPTPEQRLTARVLRNRYINDCEAELTHALTLPEETKLDMLVKRNAVGNAAYHVTYYKERNIWKSEEEELEDNDPNDAQKLKAGRERLSDEFENKIKGLGENYRDNCEVLRIMLEELGLPESYLIDQDPKNHA